MADTYRLLKKIPYTRLEIRARLRQGQTKEAISEMHELALHYKTCGRRGHFYLSKKFYDKSIDAFVKYNFTDLQTYARWHNNSAVLYRHLDKGEQSEYQFRKCLAILRDLGRPTIFEEVNLSVLLLHNLGRHEEAYDILYQHKNVDRGADDNAFVQLHLGHYYRKKGDYDRALSATHRSLNLLDQSGPKKTMTLLDTYRLLALLKLDKKEYKQARMWALSATELSEQFLGASFWTAKYYNVLGSVLIESGENVVKGRKLKREAQRLTKDCLEGIYIKRNTVGKLVKL